MEERGKLCADCRARVRTQLGDLPFLYGECAPALARSSAGNTTRVSGTRGVPSPVGDAGLAVRSRMLSALASWSGLAARALGVEEPQRSDVASLSGFLTRHLDWLAGHRSAAGIAAELAELTRDGYRAADPDSASPEPSLELGLCVHPGCRSKLSVPAAGDGAAARPPRVCCGAGHAWEPQQWLVLARGMRQRGGAGTR
ncbi:hypothetical protein LHJ74_25700 [Streptomyces sp. N2-109]|uniref:Uncharacterized protein n=1 Tax=Streptomyces gossypii TaxID=2883101 RepID=A0ABT2JZD6_9ACTN|nr:hypothetical protein [Streptomyces gossypii]MCT2593258.1 hypothetical protein [Streptomyces gossypii]